ncbi:hypothetical protein Pint_21059 [Pistacia integerrima]|uniref:Uncharacterized protein n=1 Tax=Pistacia integerrima TaxID=434235 RepID=A0ACC0XE00_9ROSI|nr:hypothetical protein Pint_21059 [Pistacia integerrima]
MSIFKIFSKKLTKTDVENRLSLPTESLSSFPPFGEHQNYLEIMVDDDEGHKWPFRLVVRRGRYRKPVLSAGWKVFVRTKQVQSGFKLKFYREEVTGEVDGINAILFHSLCKPFFFFPHFEGGQHAQVLIRVDDEQGNEWRFRLLVREGRYRKSVLSAGDWLRFVRSKQLERGFKVQILKEED